MDKLKLKILPKVSLITFITGLVIIINSAGWGSEAASAFVRAHGGGIDATQYSAILQGSINSYCIMGAVLLFIGGLGCLMFITFFEMQKQ
ncbi:Uncharacterised protein [uncultured archaeon]|nr:Uncharacterised protein [uncultured archaeon]